MKRHKAHFWKVGDTCNNDDDDDGDNVDGAAADGGGGDADDGKLVSIPICS